MMYYLGVGIDIYEQLPENLEEGTVPGAGGQTAWGDGTEKP
jgi:hypothetical protein